MIKFIKSFFIPKKFKKYRDHRWLDDPTSYYGRYLKAFSKELELSCLKDVVSQLAYSLQLAEEGWLQGYGGIDLEHGNRLDTLYKIKQEYLKELSNNWWNEYYKDIINSALKTLGSDKECHVYRKPVINIERLNLVDNLLDWEKDRQLPFNFSLDIVLDHITKAETFLKLMQRIVWDNLNEYKIGRVKVDIEYFKVCLYDFEDIIRKHEINVYYVLSVGTIDLITVKLYEDHIKKLEKIVEAIKQAIKYREDSFRCIINIRE